MVTATNVKTELALVPANHCVHYLSRTKGCVVHARCHQGDKIVRGEAQSFASCPDYERVRTKPKKSIAQLAADKANCIPCQAMKVTRPSPVLAAAPQLPPMPAPKKPMPTIKHQALALPDPFPGATQQEIAKRSKALLWSQVNAKPSRAIDQWAYGVTTVPERRVNGLLLRTLASLRAGGFDNPTLFVDGSGLSTQQDWHSWTGRENVVLRKDRVGAVANWTLAAVELLARNPRASKFAIFQDDLVCSRNVRQYLDECLWPEKGYLNLFAFRGNDVQIAGKPAGFHRGFPIGENHSADWQKGLGAVALVFSRDALVVLLSSFHVPRKLADAEQGMIRVDGMIVSAMNLGGWNEYVHNPSLVLHTGQDSSMGHSHRSNAKTFQGEQFDALELLKNAIELKV